MKDRAKPLPHLETDEAAERFVDQADLTEYDLSEMKPTRFEFENKSARVTMRLPEPLLETVKAQAEARGMPYQRLIRQALEDFIASDRP